ncbi:hypothetical protein LJ737_04380 [Hymenobacter sp. 15J16-1T3B]|uniref:hypothetical protein n=1 Tax=Hymenobacter sp. 15J16-1T3B TaxID=2886941 RepID=UPI001D0F73EA|nr:hypothetical protein [Hymenobacter sp. 15J16-1T3B]MCC3156460.1 hypothetical protein [Hymenobacter sp. 15J16-1T3B]
MSTETETEFPDLRLVPVREIRLSKVKVDKHHMLTIEYTCIENDSYSEHTARYYRPAHEDLVKAMSRLTVHCCLMTEQVNGVQQGDEYLSGYALGQLFASEDIYTAFEFHSYRCTGFTLSSGGVVLVGQKKLRTKKVLNVIAPYEVLIPENPTGNEYDWLAELNIDLDRVIEEVKAYIAGKWNDEGRQLDMFEEVEQAKPLPSTGLEEITQQVDEMYAQHQAKQPLREQHLRDLAHAGDETAECIVRTFNGKELDSE